MRNSLFVCFVLLFLACGGNNSSTSSATASEDPATDGVVSAEEFKKGLTDLTAIQLVDVRTPEEFSEGHISGALNLNFYDADFDAQIAQLDPGKPVYLYCKSGNRSGKTYKKLKDLSFPQVFDLKGGYSQWPDK